jgi:uncharacterized protein (DUF433 family)
VTEKRITINPNRMHGLPCIRDTRVTVSAIQAQLDAGASIDELLVAYPYLEREDVLAASAYAGADSRLSDLEGRAHSLVESPEGELIDDEATVRGLLDLEPPGR